MSLYKFTPVFLFTSCLLSFANFAWSLTPFLQQKMAQDLKNAHNHLSIRYAPAAVKQQLFGWSLDEELHRSLMLLDSGAIQTTRDYQQLFLKFMKSTRDHHVHVSFYSTATSFFPLRIGHAQGRYYITQNAILSAIDYFSPAELELLQIENLPLIAKQLYVGDEILEFDDQPIQEYIDELIDQYLGGEKTPTNYSLGIIMLFHRLGEIGHICPTGFFKLKVHLKQIDEIATFTFPWFHTKEDIPNGPQNDIHMQINKGLKNNKKYAKQKAILSQTSALAPLYIDYTAPMPRLLKTATEQMFSKNKPLSKKPINIGGMDFNASTKGISSSDDDDDSDTDSEEESLSSSLPPLGTITWQAPSSDFSSYIYLNPQGRRIGYTKVTDFSPFIDSNINEWIRDLKYIQKHGDALVIDLTNNPGGYVFYMYALLSTLSSTPLKLPVERKTIIQEDLYRFLNMLKVFSHNKTPSDLLLGYQITPDVKRQITHHVHQLFDIWSEGYAFTPPMHLLGIDKIMPHTDFQFTKPIVVLIDELDFSCGDLFPAILQDNKRALLFGQKTAGAGGTVISFDTWSRFGIKSYSLTQSLVYRHGGQPIENYGVTPDVVYEITEKDLTEDYRGYVDALNETMQQLLDEQK